MGEVAAAEPAHPAVEAAPERKPERIDLGGVQVRVPDGDGRDPYGRTVVTLHDADGLCINEAMVEAGLAWQYHDDGAYSQAQQAAIEADRGVHKPKSNSVKPWDWRKQHPKEWTKAKAAAGDAPEAAPRRRWWPWAVVGIVVLLAAWIVS